MLFHFNITFFSRKNPEKNNIDLNILNVVANNQYPIIDYNKLWCILKIVDFTDVNLYPKKYWYNWKDGKLVFTIRSFIIENIDIQAEMLLAKKTCLMLGDNIRVNLKFGHNFAKKNEPENWMDVHIDDIFKVTRIVPHDLLNEIELAISNSATRWRKKSFKS